MLSVKWRPSRFHSLPHERRRVIERNARQAGDETSTHIPESKTTMSTFPTHDGVLRAAKLIDPVFLNTPIVNHPDLDKELGAQLLLKDETANPIRSFKGRGTSHYAETRDLKGREIVCASAGNFGQGLTRAGLKRGAKVTVVVATTASPIKVEMMRNLGATIHVAGDDFDGANAAAKVYAKEKGLDYVEDASFPEIAEGAGTLALEVTGAGHAVDAFFVPVGGAALINGIGVWMKHAQPKCQVIGVVAEGAPASKYSFEARKVVETATCDTIADGIAIRAPVESSINTMLRVVDQVVAVSDAEIIEAMQRLYKATGVVVEPAGAAGIAAAFRYRAEWPGKTLATVLCGGNLTDAQKQKWLGV